MAPFPIKKTSTFSCYLGGGEEERERVSELTTRCNIIHMPLEC